MFLRPKFFVEETVAPVSEPVIETDSFPIATEPTEEKLESHVAPELTEILPSEPSAPATINTGKVLEMEIPINDDKEILAARVAERMAKNAGFLPAAVNQIKTALIEACLSLAAANPAADGNIYQRYFVDEEKIVITVADSKAGLDDAGGEIIHDDPERTWRLEVLRSLLDLVRLTKFEQGWRVELTRFIPQPKPSHEDDSQ